MLPQLEEYDWSEAFGYCNPPGVVLPERNNDNPVSLRKNYSREDVETILYSSEGENDGLSWIMVGKLKDGRYFYLNAGCDYTGWDCQAGGFSEVAMNLDNLLRFGCDDDARNRFGITL